MYIYIPTYIYIYMYIYIFIYMKVLTNCKSSSITLMNSIHQISLPWSILKNKSISWMFLLPNLLQVKNCAQVSKHTDTYQYLHATSCHRAVYKNSIA